MRSEVVYLEELDADAGEHELQQGGDDQDVADGLDGHEHTLNHTLHTHTQEKYTHRQESERKHTELCNNKGKHLVTAQLSTK